MWRFLTRKRHIGHVRVWDEKVHPVLKKAMPRSRPSLLAAESER